MLALLSTLAVLARPAWGLDPASEVDRLDRAAIEAYDNLNFEQARKQLSQALDLCETHDLGPELRAKTHLYLGMILIAAFQEKSEARLHFQSAVKLRPDIIAPKSLFNPEAQALFDEVKASTQTSAGNAGEEDKEKDEESSPPPPPVVRRPPPLKKKVVEDDDATIVGSGLFFNVGGGFGFGLANSALETNHATLVSGGGGVTSEKPAHIFGEFGYFLSPTMMLSAQLRVGILSGTTQVNKGGDCSSDKPCHPPTSSFAGLAKLTWFFSPGDKVVPMVSAGLGAGYVRHVVQIRLNDMDDCGASGDAACVDTVKGGPLLLSAGAGVLIRASENLGFSVGLTAIAGIPKMMLNADLNGGVVLQF